MVVSGDGDEDIEGRVATTTKKATMTRISMEEIVMKTKQQERRTKR